MRPPIGSRVALDHGCSGRRLHWSSLRRRIRDNIDIGSKATSSAGTDRGPIRPALPGDACLHDQPPPGHSYAPRPITSSGTEPIHDRHRHRAPPQALRLESGGRRRHLHRGTRRNLRRPRARTEPARPPPWSVSRACAVLTEAWSGCSAWTLAGTGTSCASRSVCSCRRASSLTSSPSAKRWTSTVPSTRPRLTRPHYWNASGWPAAGAPGTRSSPAARSKGCRLPWP